MRRPHAPIGHTCHAHTLDIRTTGSHTHTKLKPVCRQGNKWQMQTPRRSSTSKPHQYGRSQIRTGFVVRDDGPAAVPRALVWRCARGAERTLPWPGATPLKGGRGAEPADVIRRSRGSAAGLGLAFAAAGACADALAGAPAFELVLACGLSPAFAVFGGAGFAAGALEDGGLDCGRSALGGATAGSDGGARWIVTARLLLCRRYDRCRIPAAAWYSAPHARLARVR